MNDKSYDAYQKLLCKYNECIKCSLCYTDMLPKDYEDHLCSKHGYYENSLTTCVFCQNYSWPSGTKTQHGKHLHKCLKHFYKSYKAPDKVTFEEMNNGPCMECEEFYNQSDPHHIHFPDWSCDEKMLLKEFYESVFETIPAWMDLKAYKHEILKNKLQFEVKSGLHYAVDWIKRFLVSNATFFHVVVRAGCFQSFVKEMEKIQNSIVILPYWCICNELFDNHKNLLYVYQRHMIIATNNVAMLNSAFNKIRFSGELPPVASIHLRKTIDNVLQLINTIVYVSTPKCNDASIRRKVKENLHCLQIPVVPHAAYWLSTIVKGLPDEICAYKAGDKNVGDINKKYNAGNEIEVCWLAETREFLITNCVPRFDPLDLRIVKSSNLTKVTGKKYYMHWLNGIVYVLQKDKLANFEDMSTYEYALHHIRTNGNIMMNLNPVDWFRMSHTQQIIVTHLVKTLYGSLSNDI